MTRDEIYDHLAKVYLGKRENVVIKEEKKKPQVNHSWMVINVVITVVIVSTVLYGFTAFLTRKNGTGAQVMYALNNNPVRLNYDLNEPFPSTKTYAITIPSKDASKFSQLNFSIRGLNGAYPGVVKLIVQNQKREKATYYVQHVDAAWQKVAVPFEKLNLTDLTSVTEVAFVLEAWNVDFRKGTVLIDDVAFTN